MAGLFHILTLALCEGSSFSTFIAALGSVIMSNFSYSDQFIIIFICIFLKVNDVKHLFMWGFFFFFCHLSTFWGNVCSCFFTHFMVKLLLLYYYWGLLLFFLKSSFSEQFQVHSKFEQKVRVPIYAQPPLLSTLPT